MIDHIGIIQIHAVRFSRSLAQASVRTSDACETRKAPTLSEAIERAYRACIDLDYREESREDLPCV